MRSHIFFMKKLFPLPQSPNSPTEIGSSTSLATSTEHSASTSGVMLSRSIPAAPSGLKSAISDLGRVGVWRGGRSWVGVDGSVGGACAVEALANRVSISGVMRRRNTSLTLQSDTD